MKIFFITFAGLQYVSCRFHRHRAGRRDQLRQDQLHQDQLRQDQLRQDQHQNSGAAGVAPPVRVELLNPYVGVGAAPPPVMIEIHEPHGGVGTPGAAGVDGIHWPVLNNIVRQVINSLREQGFLQVPLFRGSGVPAPVQEAPFETIVRHVVNGLREEGISQAAEVQPLPSMNDFVQRVVDSLAMAPFLEGN